jgi:biopolymer transport protein ExbD
MSFADLDDDADNAALAEINMVPLIDVMLVLLVIFIVTAPLLTHAVPVELPQASATPAVIRPHSVDLSIDAQGSAWWNSERVDAASLDARLAAVARQEPQPDLRLRADRSTPYGAVAKVMAQAARHGVRRIGFVTEPDH